MLKTLESTEFLTQPGKGKVGLGGNKRARRDGSELNKSEIDNGEIDASKVGDNKVGKKGQKTSKSKYLFKCKNLSKSKKTVRLNFFTFRARLEFIKLSQAFVKAPILHHFDPECHICVETDVSGYIIGGVFSQLTIDDLGR